MHVHVGLEDDELRIDVMNQLTLLRAAPAGAVVFVAVLGRRGHGHAVVPADAAVVAAAHRAARALRQLRRIPPAPGRAGAQRSHRGHHQDLVGHPPELALSHARDAGVRLLHAPRRCRVPGGAESLAGAHAVPAAPREQILAPISAHADRRESLARHAFRLRMPACSTWRAASSCHSPNCSRSCWPSCTTTPSRSIAWRKPNTRA